MINLILNFWNKQTFCIGKLKSIVSKDWSRWIDFIRTKIKLPMQHFIKFRHSFEALVFRDRFLHGKRILQFRDKFQIFQTFSFCGFSVSINPFSFDHACHRVNRTLLWNLIWKATIFQLKSFSASTSLLSSSTLQYIHNLTFDIFNVWFRSVVFVSKKYKDCQSS